MAAGEVPTKLRFSIFGAVYVSNTTFKTKDAAVTIQAWFSFWHISVFAPTERPWSTVKMVDVPPPAELISCVGSLPVAQLASLPSTAACSLLTWHAAQHSTSPGTTKNATQNMLHWNLSWETIDIRDHVSWRTTYSWQKVPHFNATNSVMKDCTCHMRLNFMVKWVVFHDRFGCIDNTIVYVQESLPNKATLFAKKLWPH